MPIVSKAQQRFMYAKQHAAGRIGEVAREFIDATPKSAYKHMPARKKKIEKRERGFGSLVPGDR
jgi:hypothetical protein